MGSTDLPKLSNGAEPPYTRVRGTITVSVEEPCEYVTLPLVWYHDYKAVTASGQELPVTADEQGLVQVEVADMTGVVTVTYSVSVVTKAAYALSAGAALSLVAVAVIMFVRRKNATVNEDVLSEDVP